MAGQGSDSTEAVVERSASLRERSAAGLDRGFEAEAVMAEGAEAEVEAKMR